MSCCHQRRAAAAVTAAGTRWRRTPLTTVALALMLALTLVGPAAVVAVTAAAASHDQGGGVGGGDGNAAGGPGSGGSGGGGSLESGVPLGPAPFIGLNMRGVEDAGDAGGTGGDPINPLSAGTVTVPLGYANVYGGARPDLFVVNNRLSTEPGLYLYQYLGSDPRSGSPFFRRRAQCTHPFKGLLPPPGSVVQSGGVIHGFWHVEGTIVAHTHFDRATGGFTGRRELHVTGLPRPPTALAYIPRHHAEKGAGGGDLILEVQDRRGVPSPTEADLRSLGYRSPEYNPRDSSADTCAVPRDSAGTWRGGWIHASVYSLRISNLNEASSVSARRVTSTEHDVQYGYVAMAALLTNATGAPERSVIAGSVYGLLHYFRSNVEVGVALRARVPLLDGAGNVLVHPSPRAAPLSYPGIDPERHPDLIVGGEGALWFYKYHSRGAGALPHFDQPVPVGEEGGALYGGSHPAPAPGDWDGDGRTDLLMGNAEGRLMLHRNVGTDEAPVFMPGMPVLAGGAPVHVQGGYLGLQGPAEARYGYTAPRLVDWDGDGDLDVIASDVTARVLLYLNVGSKTAPRLAIPVPLRADGLEVHGPWRVQPWAGAYGARTALITLDDSGELHAYYRIDDHHLKDAGKLRLRTGRFIRCHFLGGGASGRISVTLRDWDLDGIPDLILGVPRHASVPEPEMGLPRSTGLPGGAVLLLRGRAAEVTGEMPTFRYPEIVKYKGAPVFVGREDGAATTTDLGGRGPHLLVGEEGGRVVWYHRSELSTDTVERFAAAEAGGGGGSGSGSGRSAILALGREGALATVPGTARSLSEGDRTAATGDGLHNSQDHVWSGSGGGGGEGDANGGSNVPVGAQSKHAGKRSGGGSNGGDAGNNASGEGFGNAAVLVVAFVATAVGGVVGSHWQAFAGVMRGRLASRGFATARPTDRVE